MPTAIEIISDQIAKFLFDQGLPSFHSETLVREGLEARKSINDILGMNEDNLYRVHIPLPVTPETKPELWSLVNELCNILGVIKKKKFTPIDFMFIADENKNKYRLTKLFSGNYGEIHKFYTTNYTYSELEKFIIFIKTQENDDRQILDKNFPIWYGDYVSSERRITLSSNPFDMITASSNASFTSCYSPAGGYFNGTISNSLSPHILVAYINKDVSPNYKIGRCWVYVNDKFIVPARKYGSMFGSHSIHIRNYISSRLKGDWILREGGISKMIMQHHGAGYVDEGQGERLCNKLNDSYDIPLIVPLSICLYCGEKHKDSSKAGMCLNCIHERGKEKLNL